MAGEIGLKLAICGAVASSFKASINDTKEHINSIKDKIKSVSKVKLDIKSDLNNISKLKQKLDELKTSGKESGSEYKKLSKELEGTGSKAATLSEKLTQVNVELRKLKKVARIDIKIDGAKRQLASLKEELKSTAKYWAFITGTLYANADLRQAQAGVASLGVTDDGIRNITKAAREFSTEWGNVTAPDFIRNSYAIKSSISNLSDASALEFTRISAITSNAVKISLDDSAKLIGSHYSQFRKEFATDEEYARSFSNAFAASVKSFSISGADLSAAMDAIGIDATHMGVSMAEQLTVLGKSKSIMGSTQDAVKGYKAILSNATTAQERLGIQFTDSYGQMLPMADILTELENVFHGMDTNEINEALKFGFGNDDAVKMLSAMIGKSNEFTEAYNTLDAQIKSGTIAESMAEIAAEGTEFAQIKNHIQNAAISIGGLFVPFLKAAAFVTGKVSGALTGFIENNKKLCQVVATLTAIYLTYKTVTIAVRMAGTALNIASLAYTRTMLLQGNAVTALTLKTKISAVATKLWAGFTTIATVAAKACALGMQVFSVGIRAVTLAMAANPIGLILVGVAAVIALIVFNWDKVKNGFFTLGAWLKDKFMAIWEGLKSIISTITGFYKAMFNMVKDGFKSVGSSIMKNPVFNFIVTLLKKIAGYYIKSVIESFNKLKDAISGAGSWVKEKFGGVWEGVSERINQILDFIKEKISWVVDKIDYVKNKAKAVAGFFGFSDDEEQEDETLSASKTENIIEKAYSESAEVKVYKNNNFNITLGDINVTSKDEIIEPESLNNQLTSAIKKALKQIEWETSNRRVADA